MVLEILNMDENSLTKDEVRKITEILVHPEVLELDSDYPNHQDFDYLYVEFLKSYEDRERGRHVGIVARLDGVPVGFLGIHRQGSTRGHVGDVGIAVHPDHWRKGVGSAMLLAGIDIAENIGLTRLEADTLAKNVGMRKLAEKTGFTLEGIRRKAVNMYGNLVDVALYARIS